MGTTTGARTTILENVTTLISERQREGVLILALLACTFSMLSLLGYSPTDPTWLHPGDAAVGNPCGPMGALLADALLMTVGYGATAMFLGMVGCVLALARRTVFRPLRVAAAGVLFLTALAVLHLVFRPGTTFPPGGVVGRWQIELLEATVGAAGAWLALLGAGTLGATVLGNIHWGRVAERAIRSAERRLPQLGGVAAILLRRGRALLATGASLAASWSLVAGQRSGKASLRVLRRMGRSLTRREGDFAPDADYSDRDLEPLDGHPDSFAPEDEVPDDPTAVGAPVALAEVEWEPTGELNAEAMRDLFSDLSPRASTSEAGAVPSGPFIDRDAPTRPSDDEPAPASPVAAIEVPSPPEHPPVSPASTPVSVARVVGPPSNGVAAVSVTPPAQAQRGAAAVHAAAFLEQRVEDDGGEVPRRRRRARDDFKLPRLSLLDIVPEQRASYDPEELRTLAATVEETLSSFKVNGQVTDVRVGPVVTTFEYLPDPGISVRKVANLADDLAMALKAVSVRIVAPIPGKGVVGIEIPSPQRMDIFLREMLASPEFRDAKYALPCTIGKDVEGRPIIQDLAKMPHLLVGGTTGSGKSVGVNAMLMSMLFTRTPDELRLLLVDPKILEFKLYEDIPHLLHPVVTEPNKAAAALSWACREMDARYEVLARWDTRNIASYNKKVRREVKAWTREKARKYAPDQDWHDYQPETLPYIVIVIDELADLMMVAKKDVETSIARIAQKARACGIHLIVATQRPSVDVVTGLIKSNLPTRISFKLRSLVDSRTVLDCGGAEALLGRGDMLLLPNAGDLMRCHGAFVSDEEVARVAAYLREQGEPHYVEDVTRDPAVEDLDDAERDELFDAAIEVVRSAGKASTSMIQRHLKIGYNRAARIIEQLEMAGIVGPADGARPREVL